MDPESAEVKAAGGVVWRRGPGGHRGRGRPPAAPLGLVAAQGQARPGRELGAGGAARGRGGDRLPLPARARAPVGVLHRPEGPLEGRALLADGARGGRVRPQRRGRRAALADPLRRGRAAHVPARPRARRGARHEPRALPRARRRLGTARRPRRHPDGRHGDRRDDRLDALRAHRQRGRRVPARARLRGGRGGRPRRRRADARRRRARGRVRAEHDRAHDGLLGRGRARPAARATRSSARAWTTTPTCARG